MASPLFKRIVRTIAWAVLGYLAVSLVADILLSAFDVLEDDSRGSVLVTLTGVLGAMAAATFGWKYVPETRRDS